MPQPTRTRSVCRASGFVLTAQPEVIGVAIAVPKSFRPTTWPTVSQRFYARDLNGVEFIGFDEDLPIRREVNKFFKEQGIEVNETLHFDNSQMIKEAVAHRAGVSIVPARTLKDEVEQGRLVAIPIAGSELYRPLGIIHRKKKRFHPVAQAFLELLREKPAAGVGVAWQAAPDL